MGKASERGAPGGWDGGLVQDPRPGLLPGFTTATTTASALPGVGLDHSSQTLIWDDLEAGERGDLRVPTSFARDP